MEKGGRPLFNSGKLFMEKKDCYKLLSVSEKATRGEIQKAFDFEMQKFRVQEREKPLLISEKKKLERLLLAYKILTNGITPGNHFTFSSIEKKQREKNFLQKIKSKGIQMTKDSFNNGTHSNRQVSNNMEEVDPRLVAFREPRATVTEQYRVLFTKMCQVFKNEEHKLVAVSSAVKGEGKTITSLNLAAVMAKDFIQRTLLIEGDFKKPDLRSYIPIKKGKGLVDVLLGKAELQECLIPALFENLSFLPAGGKFENSSRLLKMVKMKEILHQASKDFDFVIIDSPPVLSLADMNIFSGLVDGILLVVRAGKTPRDLVRKAIEGLPKEKILGIILNDIEQSFSMGYGYPY